MSNPAFFIISLQFIMVDEMSGLQKAHTMPAAVVVWRALIVLLVEQCLLQVHATTSGLDHV